VYGKSTLLPRQSLHYQWFEWYYQWFEWYYQWRVLLLSYKSSEAVHQLCLKEGKEAGVETRDVQEGWPILLRSVPAQIAIVAMRASVAISVKAPLVDVAFACVLVVMDPHASVKRTSVSVLKDAVNVLAMVSVLLLSRYNVHFPLFSIANCQCGPSCVCGDKCKGDAAGCCSCICQGCDGSSCKCTICFCDKGCCAKKCSCNRKLPIQFVVL